MRPETNGEVLFMEYPGDKNILRVDGEHNSERPQYVLDSIAFFFYNTLHCEDIEKDLLKE